MNKLAVLLVIVVATCGIVGYTVLNDTHNSENVSTIDGKDIPLYYTGTTVEPNDELICSYGTPDTYVYIYKIATINNFTITPLTPTFSNATNGDQFELSIGASEVSSETIEKSVSEAFSITNGSSKSVKIGVEFGSKTKTTIEGEFSWTESTTDTNSYSKTISDSLSKSKEWGAKYIIANPAPDCTYRAAYVCSEVHVYEYIVKDIVDDTKTYEYAVSYDGENRIALQKSNTEHYSLPETFKIVSEHRGDLPVDGTFGTDDNPYRIATERDLRTISSMPSKSFLLISDIKMTGTWIPFDFSGTLDGANHTIYNLNLTYASI